MTQPSEFDERPRQPDEEGLTENHAVFDSSDFDAAEAQPSEHRDAADLLQEGNADEQQAALEAEVIESPLSHEEHDGEASGPAQEIDFEDLTLAEALGRFVRAPLETWRLLAEVAQTPATVPVSGPRVALGPAKPLEAQPTSLTFDAEPPTAGKFTPAAYARARRSAIQLGLYFIAFLVAWWGSNILVNSPLRIESLALDVGAPFLLSGFLLWLIAEAYGDWPRIKSWWQQRRERQDIPETLPPEPVASPPPTAYPGMVWAGIHPARVFTLIGALALTFFAWQGTLNNTFTTSGFFAWVGSMALWSLALSEAGSNPLRAVVRGYKRARSSFHLRGNWTLVALALILLLGAYFRLHKLTELPPEMTSDHVEKLLDSQRILDGTPQVFFANNGGREPFQMYAMALFSQLPGMGMNFTALKILAVIEALITLPVLWWMGREIIGERDRRLGNLVGLTLAALVAASYWHTAMTRLSLRIIVTPLVTALLIIYLARALRHNRRNDFILAGLILGLGLYTYQAVRMLPVVIVVGVGLALVFKARNWQARGRYVVNLATLVVISFVCFVPLFGFSLQYPEDFWRRTSGRLLGDDVIQTTDAEGNIVYRNASLQERIDAFNKNVPVLMDNIRNALLMFNWKGDVAWINGVPNAPEMDALTGTLLIVGVAAWLARMIRRRDVMDWLLLPMLFIMLLPSAFSIAYPLENPSATRTSGALPEAYLLAALPLGLMAFSLRKILPDKTGQIAGAALVSGMVLGAFLMNANLYFGRYPEAYIAPSLPYSEPGRILRGFAQSDGSYGNAFVIAYPYWWDHRAVGLEAGIEGEWPNGILKAEDVPDFLFDASQRIDPEYRYDPDKDILFFYATADEEADRLLKEWFPAGRAQRIVSYQPGDDFMIYRVPFLGTDGFMQWITEHR